MKTSEAVGPKHFWRNSEGLSNTDSQSMGMVLMSGSSTLSIGLESMWNWSSLDSTPLRNTLAIQSETLLSRVMRISYWKSTSIHSKWLTQRKEVSYSSRLSKWATSSHASPPLTSLEPNSSNIRPCCQRLTTLASYVPQFWTPSTWSTVSCSLPIWIPSYQRLLNCSALCRLTTIHLLTAKAKPILLWMTSSGLMEMPFWFWYSIQVPLQFSPDWALPWSRSSTPPLSMYLRRWLTNLSSIRIQGLSTRSSFPRVFSKSYSCLSYPSILKGYPCIPSKMPS